jgi:hypothetical protein
VGRFGVSPLFFYRGLTMELYLIVAEFLKVGVFLTGILAGVVWGYLIAEPSH